MISLPLVDEHDSPILIPSDWSEVTLRRFISFYDLFDVLSTKLDGMLEEDQEPTLEFICTRYPEYILQIVSFWTELNDRELSQVDFDVIVGCYNIISHNFLNPPTKGEPPLEIKVGEQLCYPADRLVDIHGNNIPLGKLTFNEGVEYLQLSTLSTNKGVNKFDMISKQIAIIYRPKGEDFDEERCFSRLEDVKDLTMDTVWQISFFLSDLSSTFQANIHSYSEKIREALAKGLEKTLATGDGTILYTQQLMEKFTKLTESLTKTSTKS
jgi:hypothetical protein